MPLSDSSFFESILKSEFQRADLPGARTGALPPIGGSPSREARIFQKNICILSMFQIFFRDDFSIQSYWKAPRRGAVQSSKKNHTGKNNSATISFLRPFPLPPGEKHRSGALKFGAVLNSDVVPGPEAAGYRGL